LLCGREAPLREVARSLRMTSQGASGRKEGVPASLMQRCRGGRVGRQDLNFDCVPPHADFTLSSRASDQIRTILRAAILSKPLLIEGDPSTGKTSAVAFAAHLMQQPLLQFSMTPGTSIGDLVGSIGVNQDLGGLVFQEGVLTTAMKEGYWLILDEANLAPDAVLRILEDVLNDGRLTIPASLVAADPRRKQELSADGTMIVQSHPAFRLFAAQNPPPFFHLPGDTSPHVRLAPLPLPLHGLQCAG